VNDPFEQLDVDAIDTLLDSPGWELVQRRLEEMLENDRVALERTTTEGETNRYRGRVFAYRIALNLPKIMRDEMANVLKKGVAHTQGKEG
jgi:hypothetical protein